MNKLVWRVIGEFFKRIAVTRSGIINDGDTTIIYEQLTFYLGKYKLTLVAEEVVEDLNEQINMALQQENYELADELTKRLEELKAKRDGKNRT